MFNINLCTYAYCIMYIQSGLLQARPVGQNTVWATHRRRINTEEKAEVVAANWGTEFI